MICMICFQAVIYSLYRELQVAGLEVEFMLQRELDRMGCWTYSACCGIMLVCY